MKGKIADIKLSRRQKNMIWIALIPVCMGLAYWAAYHRAIPKPVLADSDIREVLQETGYNETGEITFYGENLSDIIAVYVNDKWAKGIKVTEVSDTEIKVPLSKEYYSAAGSISVRVERKVNANVTVRSNRYTIKVLPLDSVPVPEIERVSPERILCDGSPEQEIAVYGTGFEQGDVIQINGKRMETVYAKEDGSLRCTLLFADRYTAGDFKLRVMKCYNGIGTSVKSGDFVINAERAFPLPEQDYRWADAASRITAAFGKTEGTEDRTPAEILADRYEAGQRVFAAELEFDEEGVMVCGESGISFDGLCRLMAEYPDVYVIADTKQKNADAVYETFAYMREHAERIGGDAAERLVAQVYSQAMYYQVLEIYPFRSVLYTVNEQSKAKNEKILEFVEKEGLRAISVSASRMEDAEFADAIRQTGCRVYIAAENGEEDIVYEWQE